MMNVLAAFFLGLAADRFEIFQFDLHLPQSARLSALLPGDSACWRACAG